VEEKEYGILFFYSNFFQIFLVFELVSMMFLIKINNIYYLILVIRVYWYNKSSKLL